jgi:NADP-dependent 3-hydroxy acid dehydrogenase YdfG
MSHNIAGKVVVITGASGGLGEASARPDLQDSLTCHRYGARFVNLMVTPEARAATIKLVPREMG